MTAVSRVLAAALLAGLASGAVGQSAPSPPAIDVEAYGRCSAAARAQAPPGPEAVGDCRRVAEQGLTGAQYLLGVLLLRQGPDARREGIFWLERAVAAGHPPAANALAEVYLRDALPERQQLGRRLLIFALCSGYPPAEAAAAGRGIRRAELDCSAARRPDFSGEWSGKLAWVSPPREDALELRIAFSGTAVTVHGRNKDGWSEIKPGKFQARQLDDSLMITALDSGWDLDGRWVESWTLHLLRLSANEARASFLRTINNTYAPAASPIKTFVGTAEGTMRRD